MMILPYHLIFGYFESVLVSLCQISSKINSNKILPLLHIYNSNKIEISTSYFLLQIHIFIIFTGGLCEIVSCLMLICLCKSFFRCSQMYEQTYTNTYIFSGSSPAIQTSDTFFFVLYGTSLQKIGIIFSTLLMHCCVLIMPFQLLIIQIHTDFLNHIFIRTKHTHTQNTYTLVATLVVKSTRVYFFSFSIIVAHLDRSF